MTQWTDQEKRTMAQNLHLKPSVVSSVIPNKTTKQISRMRSRMLMTPPTGPKWVRDTYNSLRVRKWTLDECAHYVNAVRGEAGSLDFLRKRGLWYSGVGVV